MQDAQSYSRKYFDKALELTAHKMRYYQRQFKWEEIKFAQDMQKRVYAAIARQSTAQDTQICSYWRFNRIKKGASNNDVVALHDRDTTDAPNPEGNSNLFYQKPKAWVELDHLTDEHLVIRAEPKKDKNDIEKCLKAMLGIAESDSLNGDLQQLDPLTKQDAAKYSVTVDLPDDFKREVPLNQIDQKPENNCRHFYYFKRVENGTLDPNNKQEEKMVVLQVAEDFPTYSLMQPVVRY